MHNFRIISWEIQLTILKSRDIAATKDPIVKSMVLLVVTYGCEGWTMKAEHKELMARAVVLKTRGSWTAKRSNSQF